MEAVSATATAMAFTHDMQLDLMFHLKLDIWDCVRQTVVHFLQVSRCKCSMDSKVSIDR